ncbi:MAG: 3,4-dihydroxy-2-butanone-4-phosphate synthase [Paracoccus sp. (in: a-proteobacteria)]|nr:3,4-dihydroxy-2-butanone-4-phosphate synthase [Paracoccus sp. (in: a-proteobacteria)]
MSTIIAANFDAQARSRPPCRVDEALRRLAAGQMILVADDEDRENEADLIVAAELCTPEQMAFIIRHGCGIVCVPVSGEIAARLNLTPMVSRNDAPLATAFTVSVDARQGLTTGISATERCITARELANPQATPGDFVRPGHMFPLIARDGGVLERAGHTEAAVDLCRLAGLQPVGIICELFNDDGTVMKGAQVTAFARQHDLARLTIAELIAWQSRAEAPAFAARA